RDTQNHDVPLRTNLEKVRILKVFNGTNDVATTFVTSVVDPLLTWSVQELGLFKEANIMGVPDLYLRLTKSMVQAALSREASEYLTRSLNLDAFIDQLEQAEYGMDENMLSTLNSNEIVGLPGGFTTKCLDNGKPVWSVTRKSFWKDGKAAECRSHLIRHSICIVGVEGLAYLQALPNIYLNKMLPTVDYGAVACWLRRLREREAAGIVTVNKTTYSELPHVRFNRWKQEHPSEPYPFCAPGSHSSAPLFLRIIRQG
ncbi:Protein T14B4.9, partial [Aphelenchoides avenae]